MSTAQVGIIMGSQSDLSIMNAAAEILQKFNIPYEIDIVSAHRTPDKMFEYAKSAVDRGLKVIIAGAGGAAHLPGVRQTGEGFAPGADGLYQGGPGRAQ